MRKEKFFGYVGLAAFFLFPLLGLLQVRDTDAVWRTAADRTRPSVLAVHAAGDAARILGCAVVLGVSPLRAAMVGVQDAPALASATPAGPFAWRVIWADPRGAFTILEAGPDASPVPVAATPMGRSFSSFVPLDPARVGDVDLPGDAGESVAAALVGPAPLGRGPLWVGVLRAERQPDGSLTYRGGRLRAVRGAEALAAAEAEPPAPTTIDPALHGAPFVTREGIVLALYAGEHDGDAQAVPLALVRDALANLDRHALRAE